LIVVNESPTSFAWTVVKIRPPAWTVTFVVKGTFDLRPNQPAIPSAVPIPPCGDEYTDDDPSRGLRYPTDFSPPKVRADLLLVGHAYAPGGKPVVALPIAFQVGSWSKRIAVIGDRITKGISTSPPTPFVKMEISYENTFGGPGYSLNPLGKGYVDEHLPDGTLIRRLPNLEYPGKLLYDSSGKHEPASLASIPMTWKLRRSKAGTYGRKWLESRWPWYPEDLDWEFFNSAPPDQQLPLILRGDEKLSFENLHPVHPVFESRLPGIRVRCFFSEEGGFHPKLREIPMNLDTLWARPEEERLVLVWHGQSEIRARQLPEKGYLLIASEELQRPSRPLLHYERLLKDKIAEAVNSPTPLLIIPGPPPAPEPPPPPEVVPPKPPPPPLPPEALQLEAKIQQILQGIKPPVPPPLPPAPADPIAMAKKQAAAAGFKIPLEDPEPPPIPKEPPPPLPAEPPARDRSWCQDRLARGEDLRGLDLSGVDLSELDLAGVSFKESVLTGANLRKARLSGADLENAILAGADLSHADLKKARLSNADLNTALLIEADLQEALLDGADFSEAKLPKARLTQAQAKGSRFAYAKLSESDLQDADLTGADLSCALLHGANLTGAKLQEASLEGAAGSRMIAERADFTRVRAAGCNFGESKFRNLIAPGSIWQGAQLFRADFSSAHLEKAQFGSAYLCQAKFNLANLKWARMDQAILRKAELLRINFLQGSFQQADLTRATLAESNLFQAEFFEAVTEDASFQGANLKRTLLTL